MRRRKGTLRPRVGGWWPEPDTYDRSTFEKATSVAKDRVGKQKVGALFFVWDIAADGVSIGSFVYCGGKRRSDFKKSMLTIKVGGQRTA